MISHFHIMPLYIYIAASPSSTTSSTLYTCAVCGQFNSVSHRSALSFLLATRDPLLYVSHFWFLITLADSYSVIILVAALFLPRSPWRLSTGPCRFPYWIWPACPFYCFNFSSFFLPVQICCWLLFYCFVSPSLYPLSWLTASLEVLSLLRGIVRCIYRCTCYLFPCISRCVPHSTVYNSSSIRNLLLNSSVTALLLFCLFLFFFFFWLLQLCDVIFLSTYILDFLFYFSNIFHLTLYKVMVRTGSSDCSNVYKTGLCFSK